MEWMLAGEFELEDRTQLRVWFARVPSYDGESDYVARMTMTKYDLDTGEVEFATRSMPVGDHWV
jgi:hypothetical protein